MAIIVNTPTPSGIQNITTRSTIITDAAKTGSITPAKFVFFRACWGQVLYSHIPA